MTNHESNSNLLDKNIKRYLDTKNIVNNKQISRCLTRFLLKIVLVLALGTWYTLILISQRFYFYFICENCVLGTFSILLMWYYFPFVLNSSTYQ